MNLALVYDRVVKVGGAERILLALHRRWPEAPLYTSVYDSVGAGWAKVFPQVTSSFLQGWPLAKTHHELYPWLAPLAFESFNFDQFDLVISVASAEAKTIVTKPQTSHLCYCLTPTRYLWSHHQSYLDAPGVGRFSRLGKKVFAAAAPYLKRADLVGASRPDHYLAISQTVKKRLKKYYHRDSEVIYPPVDTAKFSKKITNYGLRFTDYFLVVSRLTPYKKVDLAIKVFNQLRQNLVIVGSGREEGRLKSLAGPSVYLLGEVGEKNLVSLYQHCRALVMPQEEDFGIVAVEAQAAGRPVIAFKKGGATETVVDNKTGIFFAAQTGDSMAASVKRFNSLKFNAAAIKSQAENFNYDTFAKNLKRQVKSLWKNHH